jgi:hypothetical protein
MSGQGCFRWPRGAGCFSDAMYVAVAVARLHETRMLTADRKLVDDLVRTDSREAVQWLGDRLD